jgi:hypothetical protein
MSRRVSNDSGHDASISAGFPQRRLLGVEYDQESRMRTVRLDPGHMSSTDRENMMFASSAEAYPSLPPFLSMAIQVDRPRRNYFIKPGGQVVFYDPANPPPPDPTSRRLYTVPSEKVSLGGGTLPGMLGYQNLAFPSTSGRQR